jgi:hypothetical protein
MQKRFRSSKRALTKRVTSFNFYVDQATQIQAIMEATGTTMEAPLVRQLVDEALAARRRKLVPLEAPTQAPPLQDQSEILETIQTLLLRIMAKARQTIALEALAWNFYRKPLPRPTQRGSVSGNISLHPI